MSSAYRMVHSLAVREGVRMPWRPLKAPAVRRRRAVSASRGGRRRTFATRRGLTRVRNCARAVLRVAVAAFRADCAAVAL